MRERIRMKKKLYISERMRFGIVALIFILITTLMMAYSPMAPWRNGETGLDSSIFRYIANAMLKGYMPYKDSFDHKGPLIYFINLMGSVLSVERGVWYIEFIALFFTLCMFYKTGRLFCTRPMAIIVVVIVSSTWGIYFEEGNLVEEYALPFLAVSMYIFYDYFINGIVTQKRLIVCGLAFGAVCMLRPNMIALWVVFCIAILVDCVARSNYKELGYYIMYFAIGIAVIFVPIFLWLLLNNSFNDFFSVYFRFNMTYSSDRGIKDKILTFFWFLNDSRMILALVILLFLAFKERTLVNITSLGYYFLSILLVSMSGRMYGHYGMVLIPVLCYPFARVGKLIEKQRISRPKLCALGGVFLVVLSCIILLSSVRNVVKKDFAKSELTTKVVSIVEDNTVPDDKISVYGNWNIIYILSDRLSASQYSYQFPIGAVNPDIFDVYFEELREENPKIIVTTGNRFDKRMETFLYENDYHLLWSEESADGVLIYYSGA